MNAIDQLISALLPYTEWAMLFLLLGGGLYLAISSGFKPYLYFKHAIDITRGKYDKEGATGEVSHWQALSSAIAATVGLGNISGVAIAIYLGGPGVIFWIWVTAVLGMVIKYYSCSLAVMFRAIDASGTVQGGPMYYMNAGLKQFGRPLAVFYSIFGMIGFLAIFQANQFTQTFMTVVSPNETLAGFGDFGWKLIIGLLLAGLTSLVIFGGIQKIAKVASRIVPTMVLVYFVAVLFVLLSNLGSILPSFKLIITEAFNFETAIQGGIWGVVILGARRAMFSNEAGLGSAPMYHGQSKTDEPIQEGLVAMLGPFIDTIVVCTITALVILLSGAYLEAETNGILMTLIAFKKTLFGFGDVILMIVVSAFALSTIFTYSYFGVKSLSYLTRSTKAGKYFNYFYIITIVIAAISSVDLVVNLMDLAYSLMLIPNMIAVLLLSPKVNAAARSYFQRFKANEL